MSFKKGDKVVFLDPKKSSPTWEDYGVVVANSGHTGTEVLYNGSENNKPYYSDTKLLRHIHDSKVVTAEVNQYFYNKFNDYCDKTGLSFGEALQILIEKSLP